MMAEQPDVIERADSLIQGNPAGSRRRRSFVASPLGKPEPVIVPTLPDDDDLPVLTEIVPAEVVKPESNANRMDETQVSILAAEIAHAIEQQMTFELPTLLEATLLTASADLRAGITATMETALRDFIARRRQLRLPLDDPNQDD